MITSFFLAKARRAQRINRELKNISDADLLLYCSDSERIKKTEGPESCAELVSVLVQELFCPIKIINDEIKIEKYSF